ncbi:DUF2620 domain-containing protein [Bacillus mycoides]|uniref:DUF2620 domain-containing protein n=1 Tax=Bacillus mycoides TaxID=1405 RepID=UPI001038D375|nr:DUF2620 domain-containing protein [Bacillus mycoides]TBX72069.1 DUF2620 domain-containing protein [Bacillus mycoides]
MKKIVIGGQVAKTELASLVEKYANGAFTWEVKSDLDAAMAIKSGAVDYYVGACNTGGGGALAMAIALLGGDKCVSLGMPGKTLSADEIKASVAEGKVAFGFTPQDMEFIISNLMECLLNKGE